jgi:glycosyltransferase involved in cell wall biosynthesis
VALSSPSASVLPVVSVIVPTYNRAARLEDCLRSIVAAAAVDSEIIVVDDGSTDNTSEVVAQFPEVRYLRQANRGPSAARNAGARLARGRYLAFFDSDDVMLAGARERITRFLDDHADVGAAFTNAVVKHLDGATEEAFDPADGDAMWSIPLAASLDGARVFDREAFLQSMVIDRCYLIPSITILRRSVFEAVGGFDESLVGYEEWDLFSRMAARCSFAYFDEPSAVIMKHESNLSGNLEAMVVQGVAILRKFLDGALPLHGRARVAVVKKLDWMMLDVAKHAFSRGDFPTARRRALDSLKRAGHRRQALALWCATWLRPAQVQRLRAWKARVVLHGIGDSR